MPTFNTCSSRSELPTLPALIELYSRMSHHHAPTNTSSAHQSNSMIHPAPVLKLRDIIQLALDIVEEDCFEDEE
jgi:hypothetical protein